MYQEERYMHMRAGTCGGQKRVLDPPELEYTGRCELPKVGPELKALQSYLSSLAFLFKQVRTKKTIILF